MQFFMTEVSLWSCSCTNEGDQLSEEERGWSVWLFQSGQGTVLVWGHCLAVIRDLLVRGPCLALIRDLLCGDTTWPSPGSYWSYWCGDFARPSPGSYWYAFT